jgi:hypothetical protein
VAAAVIITTLVLTAFIAVVSAGRYLATHSSQTNRKQNPQTDLLQPNSRWEGAFKFRPPNQDATGAVVFDVQSRDGDRFTGHYATENGKWQYEVLGRIRESEISLEFTRIIHEAEPRRIVGIAKVTGRLDGDRMVLLYQDEDSVADMTLWRAN